GAHAGTKGAAHVGHRDVALQVDEMRRPILPIAGDDPVRHDRALAAPAQVTGCCAHDLDVRRRRVRDETRKGLVVPKAALRLAEEVQGRVEATRNAKEIALDLAAGTASGERGDGDAAEAPTLPSPASGGGKCVEDGFSRADVDDRLDADAGSLQVPGQGVGAVIVREDDGA